MSTCIYAKRANVRETTAERESSDSGGELGLTVFLGDLEPGSQVWVEVVFPVKGAPRVDIGFEREAGEEGEPDGRGLQDLFARGGC